MNYQEIYQQKLTTAERIVENIQSGFCCAATSALGEPSAIMKALAERVLREDLRNIEHHMLLASREERYLDPVFAGKIIHVPWFTSGKARPAVWEGRADFMPNFYYEVPRMWRENMSPDVFYAMVSPMDKHGFFSFGVGAAEGRAQMSNARYVFLEVNRYMPRVLGDNFVHISEVDAICECDEPLPTIPDSECSEKDKRIGQLIAERIPDGATLQLGIGDIPNAVGEFLSAKKHLGIHSELFCDSFVKLIQSGAVDNSCKNINRGKSVATFAIGSQALFEYIDDNPGVEFYPVDYVNDPRIIAQNDYMISVNSCVEVDLVGQVCSESIGHKNISGAGGQVDFIRGANWSKGGRSFICTYATAKNDTISKIKPFLTEGAHVTTSKGDVDCIVTEYGIAELRGKTAAQRARALISVAHPKFREELLQSAKAMHLMI